MKRDLLMGFVSLFFIILFFIATPFQASPEPVWGARGYGLTGRTFPIFAGSLFFLANVAFLVSIYFRKKAAEKGIELTEEKEEEQEQDEIKKVLKKEDDEEEENVKEDEGGITKKELFILCAVVVGALVYIQLMEIVGYVLSTVIAVGTLSWFLGNKKWWGLLILTVVFAIAVWMVFGNLLHVPLPRGFIGF